MSGITDLSLFNLDADLAGLLSLREEMAATGEDISAIESEIKAYLKQLPVKVSGVCAYLRWRESQLVAILGPKDANGTRKGGEVGRLKALAEHIEDEVSRLKNDYIAPILEAQPEPKKGSKKLTGADGSSLSLRGNGGVQPLSVDITILPSEYFDVVARMPMRDWKRLYEDNPHAPHVADITYAESNSRIREALAQPCPACNGSGDRPSPAGSASDTWPCWECNSTGKQGVPGCSVLPRGKSVVIA